MNFINYKGYKGIETIEDMRQLSRKEKRQLLAEYKLVSGNYYASQRATKEFYQTK